jgi:predicted DNA-binding protein YlxM (UPF0122 family)
MEIRYRKDGLTDTSIFRFVWVTFEDKKIKKDEDYLNKSISQGYEIAREHQTERGLVFSMIKNVENHVENTNQKVMEDYGFDSKIGGLQK